MNNNYNTCNSYNTATNGSNCEVCNTCNVCRYSGCNTALRCYNVVLAIIGVLLAFVVGIIIGALFIDTTGIIFTVFVAIAVILAVMLVVFLILRYCNQITRC